MDNHIVNPLLMGMHRVQGQVDNYRRRARSYYFDVVLSTVQCPNCHGRLEMTGQSQCRCQRGHVFDPTMEFQNSPCCGAKLQRKTFHYACSQCGKTVQSRFIFNERLFDKAYFKQMMRDCRERKKRKREEIRQLLAASRSHRLEFTAAPDLGSIPGLLTDLDDFIHQDMPQPTFLDSGIIFNIANYREHILSRLGWSSVSFHKIVPMDDDDKRRDRARRFITLIFMQSDQEVEIEQLDNDLMIQRVYNEAHC